MSAPVTRTEPMDFGEPERLFKADLVERDLGSPRFAVAADGERFLVSWPKDPVRSTDTTALRRAQLDRNAASLITSPGVPAIRGDIPCG